MDGQPSRAEKLIGDTDMHGRHLWVGILLAAAGANGFAVSAAALRPARCASHARAVATTELPTKKPTITKTSKAALGVGLASVLASWLPATTFAGVAVGTAFAAKCYQEAWKAADLDSAGLIVCLPEWWSERSADASRTTVRLSEMDELPLTKTSKVLVAVAAASQLARYVSPKMVVRGTLAALASGSIVFLSLRQGGAD